MAWRMNARIIYTHLIILLILATTAHGNSEAPLFFIHPDRVFTKGRLFYNDLTIDASTASVYVGAMNTLYKLWYKNINDTTSRERYIEREIFPTEQAVMNCAYKSREQETQCQNYIRVFAKLADSSLLACGTNAYNPKVYKLQAETLKIMDDNINGVAICPVGPNDNTTALWVEQGNPTDAPSIYSATVTDFTRTNHIIYRPPLIDVRSGQTVEPFMRTIHTDSKWLNEPNFVGSYEIDQYVYFFFREVAVEFINCGKAVYSRVARICKNDTGGQHVLKQNWATFLKARLNCSISGEFPFYFDEIQDVLKTVDHKGDVYFDAIFTTNLNGFFGSALCSFSLKSINEVFDKGIFKEQATSSAMWMPVLSSQVPVPRPGQCTDNTKLMSDTALHFIKSHPLMDTAIHSLNSENGNDQIVKPLFYKRDVVFKKLALDKFGPSKERNLDVIYITTDKGEIYKIVRWFDSNKHIQSKLLAVYQLISQQPIKSISVLEREFIYLAQDAAVSQISLPAQCSKYMYCISCSADPYCQWNREKSRCQESANLGGDNQYPPMTSDCPVDIKQSSKLAYPSETIYLDCAGGINGLLNARRPITYWMKNKATVKTESHRYLRTNDGGLVIVNVSSTDSGQYECFSDGQLISIHNLLVNNIDCEMPRDVQSYRAIYREWCREFQEYKHKMGEWSKRRSDHLQCSRTKTRLDMLPSGTFNVNFSDRRRKDTLTNE